MRHFILDNFFYLCLDHSTPRSPAKRARTQLQFPSPVEESTIFKPNDSNSEKVVVDESPTVTISRLNQSLHNLTLTSLNKNYSRYGSDPFDESSSSGASGSETDSGSESSFRYSLSFFVSCHAVLFPYISKIKLLA